jgi:hypothetical protein
VVNHLLAILGLGLACIVWFALQRGAGRSPEPECEEPGAACGGCARREDGCPQSPRTSLFG